MEIFSFLMPILQCFDQVGYGKHAPKLLSRPKPCQISLQVVSPISIRRCDAFSKNKILACLLSKHSFKEPLHATWAHHDTRLLALALGTGRPVCLLSSLFQIPPYASVLP